VLCVRENSSEMGLNSQHAPGCTSVLYEVMLHTEAIDPQIVREQDRTQQTHIQAKVPFTPKNKCVCVKGLQESQYTLSPESNNTAILIKPHP